MWMWMSMSMLALSSAQADELAVSSVLTGETLTLRYSGAPAGEEVFFYVTDDGAETDLDLGHYERFTGVPARSTDSVSSGRIYSNVLEKERRGDYLGKTIQVIPHVTNEIKDFIEIGSDEVDFMLCEIGGTVGDIEGLPFFEAIRQFSQDKPRGQCIFMHLTLDRKSTRLNSSHVRTSRMPSSA